MDNFEDYLDEMEKSDNSGGAADKTSDKIVASNENQKLASNIKINFEDYLDQMELGELSEIEEDDNDSQESLTTNANEALNGAADKTSEKIVAANTHKDLGDILWRGYEKLHYEQPNKIFCANKINVKGSVSLWATHDKVDNLNFDAMVEKGKSFVEFLIKPDYVHLYLDIDDAKTLEDYLRFKAWLIPVSEVFGKYSIGGYTNSEEFAKEGFRLWKESEKVLSLHVVFYETCISSKDLMEIMKFTIKEGILNYILDPLVDPNVYKLDTRQAFRHVLTDKIYDKKGGYKYKPNHGTILNGLKPSTQILTVRGDEPIIKKEQWIKVFPPKVREDTPAETEQNTSTKKPKKEQQQKKEKKEKAFHEFELRDVEFNEGAIILTDDELIKLLNNFESHNNNLVYDIAPLYNSPYTKEKLVEVITKWYNLTPHKSKDDIAAIVNKYYHFEHNNKWLFSLVKKIPDEAQRREWYGKLVRQSIDETVNINNSDICFNDLRKKKFSRYQLPSIITKLRGSVAQCQGLYYMKEKIDGQFIITKYSKERFKDIMSLCKPFAYNNNINLFQIFNKYSNHFTYDDIKLSKENIPDVINYFQGYKHKEIITDDFTILEPLLEHVKHIICNDDERKYEYIMNWFANIVQNLSVKNGTLPIIHGAQGSGKSCFAELMCELLGNLALYNNDDLDKVFGKFNSISDGKVLIVLNETAEADEKFSYSEKLKSRITQIHTIYESKGVDQRAGYNYANYVMTSNNANPIRAQKGDRRTIYFPTNNEKIGDRTYFKNLHSGFQPKKQGEYNPEYMGVLLHYMLTKFHPEDYDFEELIFEINNNTDTDYNENLERQYNDLNGIEQYIVDNSKEFKIGFGRLQNIKLPGFPQKSIIKILNKYCNTKRIYRNSNEAKAIDEQLGGTKDENMDGYFETPKLYIEGSRTKITIYRLKEEKEIPDFWNIIKYKEYQEQHEE